MQGALAKQKWEAIVEQTEPIIQGIEDATFTPTDLKRLASAIRSQSEIAGKVFEHQLSLYDQQVAKLNELIKDKLSANNIPATEANVQKVADKIFAGLVQHDWTDIVKKVQRSLANDKASKVFQKKIDKIANNTDKLAKDKKAKKAQDTLLNLDKKNSVLQKVLKVTVGLPLRLAVNKELRSTLRKQFKDFRSKLFIRIQKFWGVLRNPGKYIKQALIQSANKLKQLVKTGVSNTATYLGFTDQDKRATFDTLSKARNTVRNKARKILQPILPNAVADLRNNKKRALRAKVLSNMRDMGLKPKNINSVPHIIHSNCDKDREYLIQTGIAKGIQAEHNVRSAYHSAKDTVTNAYNNSRVSGFITVFNEWRKEQDIRQKVKDKWERVKTSKISKLVGKSLDKYKKLYKESKEQIEETAAGSFFKSTLDKLGGFKYILGGGLAVAIGTALWKAFDVGEFLKKVGSSIWSWFVDLLPDAVKKFFNIDQPNSDNTQPDITSSGINQDKDYWSGFIGPDKKFEHLPDPTTTDYTKLSLAQKHELSNDDPDVRRKIAEITVQQAKQKQSKLPVKPKINQQELDKKSLSLNAYNKKYGIQSGSDFSTNSHTSDSARLKEGNVKSVMPDKVETTDLSKAVPKRDQAKAISNKQKSGTSAGNVFNLSTVPIYGRRDNDGLAVINTFSY